MSCYEWSYGEIRLPSSEFSATRKYLQAALHQDMTRQFETAQQFWKGLDRRQRENTGEYHMAVGRRISDEETMHLLHGVLFRGAKPRRVVRTDLEWPTNRTMEFHQGDLSLYFKRESRTVIFEIGEGNHAREHADKTSLAKAFYARMKEVRWTAGTGGVVLGNDEYNREAGYEYPGAGGSYVVAAYGPVGAKEAPGHVASFLNGKGVAMKPEVTTTARGGQKVKIVPVSMGRRY